MTNGGHRLTRLAMDLRVIYDEVLLEANFRRAAELKRIAKELDQFRIDLESAPAAADTGVIDMGGDVLSGPQCSHVSGSRYSGSFGDQCVLAHEHEGPHRFHVEDVDETKRTR